MQGTITKITDKGYGFIRPRDGGPDVFFHATALVGLDFDERLTERSVWYDIERRPDGRERGIAVRSLQ